MVKVKEHNDLLKKEQTKKAKKYNFTETYILLYF